ncbi:uncharacterized protein PGTG_20628 [Puccinia graminis f. sp. tritici CRL 75-36-700-3]|uniref:Uncharacterized protein n=1 Tax=Puccinia graminis f. sp. tritici (strain CRL 75-36-700-3 / race SCCL) TaxID=418459 RepID=H6QNW7_PUCGT|nr:uncharacterized protein PGTG_20628 [Puccinia graminis f. sp. tritici CRL 75-36-700-3]EHS62506.1 hypothetical protein PGTG_20628 [Puccinia graminis f. sp. tritici CRL 75-36-700-3]
MSQEVYCSDSKFFKRIKILLTVDEGRKGFSSSLSSFEPEKQYGKCGFNGKT